MKTNSLLSTALSALLITSAAKAQIFADIDISQGETSLGTIRITLEHERAPRPVANFIGLATGERPWVDPTTGEIQTGVPYYDGQIFHRLIHNFVIQGGDPTGTGTGGPGFVVLDQYDPALRHSGRYIVSSAKTADPNTTGSQFFITFSATPNLDDLHSIFGTVTGGREIIDNFTDPSVFPTAAGDRPQTDITMDAVRISGPDLASFDIDDPSHRLPQVMPQEYCGVRDDEAETFDLVFDREAQFNYLSFFSDDLESWSSFRNILSLDAETDFPFTITGLSTTNFPRIFFRQAAVDYSQVFNPTPDLFSDGSSLTFNFVNGDSVTITSDGEGAGTWSDSDGASGNLTNLTITDSAPAVGEFISTATQAQFISILRLNATFETPTSVGSWLSLTGAVSFHTEASGGFEGSTNSGVLNIPFTFNE